MTTFNYWEECIADAACECGVTLTKEQIKAIAECVEGAHENYSEAFGMSSLGSDRIADIKRDEQARRERIEREAEEERRKSEQWKEVARFEIARLRHELADSKAAQ